jgi:DNA mismatch repair protein MutL
VNGRAARQPATPPGTRPGVPTGAARQAVGGAGAKALLPPSEARPAATDPEPVPGDARPLQVLGCNLVVESGPDEVLFVDQHALHERVIFGRLMDRLAAGPLETQRLLVPESVDLTAPQAALVLEHRGALAELGLPVEGFGGSTVLLGGYPAALGRRPPADLLRAVAEHLAGQGAPPDRGRLLHDLAALAACHAAVRAGDRLSPAEVRELLVQRDLARDAHHCPHGRPTSVVFGRRDLERMFKRA